MSKIKLFKLLTSHAEIPANDIKDYILLFSWLIFLTAQQSAKYRGDLLGIEHVQG